MRTNSRISFDAGRQWEHFAETDPYLYILTTMKRSDPQVFWESGSQIVQKELLPLVQERSVRRGIAFEIGAGIGRIALPLAKYFRETVGIDIAAGMVKKAVTFARDNGIRNVSFYSVSGPENVLQRAGNYAGACDLIYSLLVFQHIPSFSMIEGYLHVVRVLLHPRGLAYLQFDTRPTTVSYRIKTALPDFILPRFWKRGIRRIRRSPQEIEVCFRRAGLDVVGELTPRTAYHRYILRVAAT